MSENEVLMVKNDIPTDMILQNSANEEVMRFCPDGRILVKGKETTTDMEVVEGFRSFLGLLRGGSPTVTKMKDVQKIHFESTDMKDPYFKGMYNGMEVLISVISHQEPKYIGLNNGDS
jgi:hypothetical protein